MTDREALERVLEALREIAVYPIEDSKGMVRMGDVLDIENVAREALNEIQRGRWLESVFNRYLESIGMKDSP